MSDIHYRMLEKGDTVYFARVLPTHGIYDMLNLHINTIKEDYCTGVNTVNKQTFLFNRKDAENILFSSIIECKKYLEEQKKNNKTTKVFKE